jgi:hypothetical protein
MSVHTTSEYLEQALGRPLPRGCPEFESELLEAILDTDLTARNGDYQTIDERLAWSTIQWGLFS